METDYKNKVLQLIGLATIIRCIIAACIELGNDEVYYWTYSQQLQWNYFDHPPMVALWIKVFTANLLLENQEFFIRLGSIVSAAISTWLIYKITAGLHSQKAGWFAACLYTTSVYASIIAGVFILPDSPQILFWCWCLYLLAKISLTPASWKYWMLFGISLGLCLISKVHGVFIPFGLLVFILFKERSWLKLPQLYVALLLTAVIASPILFWNISNDFITYRYHSERVTVNRFELNTTGFFRELFGQILYNNPFNVAMIIAAIIAWRKKKVVLNKALSIYAYMALPMIGILIFVALFRDTLPHWSGPAYVTLLPLTGIYLTTIKKPVLFPGLLRWALGIILFVVFVGLILINFYPGTLGRKSATDLGTGDFTLDLYGWEKAGIAFKKIYQQEIANRTIPEGTPVVSYKWFPAAHEDYYFCRPLGIQMIGLGTLNDLHHYKWMNDWRSKEANLSTAYCIVPSNENDDALVRYADYYATIDSVTTIEQKRSGKVCRYFTVYRLQGWKGKNVLVQ